MWQCDPNSTTAPNNEFAANPSTRAQSSFAMIKDKPAIYLADGDPNTVNILRNLLAKYDVAIKSFKDGGSLLNQPFDEAACLLIEVDLPDANGVEILERLNAKCINVPTIVIATSSDVPTAVRAMRAKAVDFIEKPFVEGLLLKRLKQILKL